MDGNLPFLLVGDDPKTPYERTGSCSAAPCDAVLFFLLTLSGFLLFRLVGSEQEFGVGLVDLQAFRFLTGAGQFSVIPLFLSK